MNLHELLITPGARLSFRQELSLDRLDFPGVLSYNAPPLGEGVIENSADVLTLRGVIRAGLHCACDRCAREFDRDVEIPLDVPLATELQDEESPDYFLLEGDELDLEDLLETFVLSFVYEGRLSTFAPVTHLSRTGITLIRPFLYLPEKEIIGTVRQKEIPVYKNPCPVDGSTKRVVAREFINMFLKHNPDAKKSMLSAIKSAGTYNFFDLPPGLRQLAQREPFTERP